MLAKRACDIYLRGLKRLMNEALRHAMPRELLVKKDEWREGELVRSIVRVPGARPVVVRERGPRSFDEIPPSEIQLVARRLLMDYEGKLESGSEFHLKEVLARFDLRRLTTRVGRKLLDILERKYLHVDEFLDGGTTR